MNIKPNEILQRLCVQFGNETVWKTQVFAWHKLFFSNRNEFKIWLICVNQKSTTPKNIHEIQDLIEDDQWVTADKISAKTGISHNSLHTLFKMITVSKISV